MPDPTTNRLNVLPTTGAAGKLEEWKNQPAPTPREPDALDAAKSPEEQALEAKIADQIRLVFDPEIPVNVYDLGLIYAIHADAEGRVKIDMTLTAPGCPVAGELPLAVERRVEELDEVKSAKVELVWEPAWDKSRMSEAAMLDLGLL